MNEDFAINIRAIQHYMYCPRRFALLEVNNDWVENVSVVKANLMHNNVHDGSHRISSRNIMARSSVTLYNDNYNIFGVADCVEFKHLADGSQIAGMDGRYAIAIVEYKPTPPKEKLFHETDAIQVFAQKKCADYLWHCDCEAYIYYSQTRKRIKLPFDTESEKYDTLLKKYLSEMHCILQNGNIPLKRKGQNCSGCSIADVCFPKSLQYSVRENIMLQRGDGGK